MITVITQGLIFSLVATAVYLTSRVLKKDDLTVEGSFGFGGALTALLLQHHVSPIIVLVIALFAGAVIGATTGGLFTKLKMNHLMAGLVTTTACFSLSLAMASANKLVAPSSSLFALIPIPAHFSEIAVLFLIAVLIIAGVLFGIRTEIGLLLRAVGNNPELLMHLGKSQERYYVVGFAVANGLTALAGSLFVQWSGFFSITGSVGTLVTGLASLMIAELFCKKLTFAIMIAAILYQGIFLATLMIGLAPVWNNLVKALIMVALVALSSSSLARGRRTSC